MGWDDGTKETTMEMYTEKQIETVLRKIGVSIAGDTQNDFLCFCPFHGNTNTPSFTVSRFHGAYHCQNAACAESGSFLELIRYITRKNEFEIARMILKAGNETAVPATEVIAKIQAQTEEIPEFSQSILDRAYEAFWENSKPQEYMHSRLFEEETLKFFKVGYSVQRDLVMVPMHDWKGKPVGVIGRSPSHETKIFKNSIGLPTSKTLYNLHRARAHETLIIVEASFDAMRVHQAGYPNVAACLGGTFNYNHAYLVDKYFDRVIIMTDFDNAEEHVYRGCRFCKKEGLLTCKGHNPGRKLGQTIVSMLPNKRVDWAVWDYKTVYPDGAKDPGGITDSQIQTMIKEAVSNMEYQSWGIAS